MMPTFKVLSYEFTSYGLFALIGVLCAVGYCLWQCKKNHLVMDDMVNLLAYSFIGAAIGAKVLYILTSIPEIWENRVLLFSSFEIFSKYFFSGFVFYGGIIGALIGTLVYGKQFKVNVVSYIRIAIPAVPLFHLFGRLGCFFTGCCYGIESTSMFAISYHSNLASNSDAMRIPIQLIEACCNSVLFLVLHVYTRKYPQSFQNLVIYFGGYAIIRFIIEFFRGDEARGLWLFSTSQWISILIALAVLYCLKNKDKVKRKVYDLFTLSTLE